MNLKRGIFFGSAYSLAQSTDDADGPLSLPADNFNLRGERGWLPGVSRGELSGGNR